MVSDRPSKQTPVGPRCISHTYLCILMHKAIFSAFSCSWRCNRLKALLQFGLWDRLFWTGFSRHSHASAGWGHCPLAPAESTALSRDRCLISKSGPPPVIAAGYPVRSDEGQLAFSRFWTLSHEFHAVQYGCGGSAPDPCLPNPASHKGFVPTDSAIFHLIPPCSTSWVSKWVFYVGVVRVTRQS